MDLFATTRARVDVIVCGERGLAQDCILTGMYGPEVVVLQISAIIGHLLQGSEARLFKPHVVYMLRLYPTCCVPEIDADQVVELLVHCVMGLVQQGDSQPGSDPLIRACELLDAFEQQHQHQHLLSHPLLMSLKAVVSALTRNQPLFTVDPLALLQAAAACTSGLLHLWFAYLPNSVTQYRRLAVRELRDRGSKLTLDAAALQLGFLYLSGGQQLPTVNIGVHTITVKRHVGEEVDPIKAAEACHAWLSHNAPSISPLKKRRHGRREPDAVEMPSEEGPQAHIIDFGNLSLSF